MKPVMQTRFGRDGNCFAACVASIFDLDLDQVPDFAVKEGIWWEQLCEWSRSQGFVPLMVKAPFGFGFSCIASGISKRGLLHAVVWEKGKMIHDPHPDNTGIEGVNEFLVFVPTDYGRTLRALEAMKV